LPDWYTSLTGNKVYGWWNFTSWLWERQWALFYSALRATAQCTGRGGGGMSYSSVNFENLQGNSRSFHNCPNHVKLYHEPLPPFNITTDYELCDRGSRLLAMTRVFSTSSRVGNRPRPA
jgi:hypothetical protein